jgi:uncharacterized repeat protein (TIGR03803 family)
MKRLHLIVGVCLSAAILAACSSGSSNAVVPTAATHIRQSSSTHYKLLYSFGRKSGDGQNPVAGLTVLHGLLYSTTYSGGANGEGTVFSINTSGVEKVLHSFGGTGDGANPAAGLVAVNGVLYGTTYYGGAYGGGTVFSITKGGVEKVLHSFGPAASYDGWYPQAGLVAVNRVLYGTTQHGGVQGDGTIFSITTSGIENVLWSFQYYGPAYPAAGLVPVNGYLYGTTEYGGAYPSIHYGTVFSWLIGSSSGLTVLHGFGGGTGDGAYPVAGLAPNGVLYGTAAFGGANNVGIVFSITTGGKEKMLYSFGGSGDGSYPVAGLVAVNSVLYGTTQQGGANCAACGTAFSITTSGTEAVLHSFGGSGDGVAPWASLTLHKTTLYGTTYSGGAHNQGTVFSLKP